MIGIGIKNMKLYCKVTTWVCIIFCFSTHTAYGWGPNTQVSLVSASAQVISQDGTIPLIRLQTHVRQGASIDAETQAEMYPQFAVNPVSAIQREMYLLQSVKDSKLDPYFAFRLGALGKMVVQTMTPMPKARRSLRNQYYSDVDTRISQIKLINQSRTVVDPHPYFRFMVDKARASDNTIQVDYRSGIGFNGLARASLSRTASFAVDAVADVWYTIFASPVARIDISKNDIRGYVSRGIEYYLTLKNVREVDDLYAIAEDRDVLDDEMRKEIGDRYYAAGREEKAVEEYQKILDNDPSRRDVSILIADYYVKKGNVFRESYEKEGEFSADSKKLESALEAYTIASRTDSLHPEAERNRLQVAKMIRDRESRLSEQQSRIQTARQLERRSQEATLSSNTAQAIALLKDAEENYMNVTDEFSEEANEATRKLRSLQSNLNELRKRLVKDAQELSGSGFSYDVRYLANKDFGIEKSALKTLVEMEYQTGIRELQNQLVESP